MKHLTIMKLTAIVFIILFLSCFFEATNPLDSAYQGSYKFESTDTVPLQLEVLRECRIKFNNNGADKYWKFYCSFDPPIDSFIRNDSSMAYPPDTGSVYFVFKKAYTGKITLVAEQPNRTKVEMPLHKENTTIQVVNPYTIDGPRLAGIGDSVFLRALYNGETIQTAGTDTVIIDKDRIPINKPYLVKSDVSTTKGYSIHIKRNNDSITFPVFTISYRGYAPGILQFSRTDSADSLRLGCPAGFNVRLFNDGKYSGTHIYKITSGTRVLSIDTVDYIDSNSIQVVTIDTLTDTFYSKIMLTVYNKDTLTDTMSLTGLNVYPVLPEIGFRDSSTSVEQDSTFKVDVTVSESMGKDSFTWSYRDVKDSVTSTPYITLPPMRGVSDSVSVYVKRTYNFGDRNYEYISDTISKVFHSIVFNYKIQMKSIVTKQIVSRNTEKFQVTVTNGQVPVPDSSLTYSWIFPSVDTNYVKIVPKTPTGSNFFVTVLDSTKLSKFYFSVKAKLNNGTDSTALLKSEDIIVRNYRPSLTLSTPATATTLSQVVSFGVSDSNGVVSMVYYKFSDTEVSDDRSVQSVAPQSQKFVLYFKRNGTASVKAWAVDTSGFVSDTQTVKFKVEVNTPQFPIKPDTVEATIGVAKTLHARLASSLNNITYYWDRNGNRKYGEDYIDTTTIDSDSISFAPLDTISDTIFVQCQNKSGEWAPNPYTLIVIARKNEPTIDTLRIVDTTARYGNDSLQIKAVVSDRDSNLARVKITWSFNGSVDTVLCDSIVKAPFKSCVVNAVKKNNRYGTYKFTVTATDSRGNVSASFVNHTLLRGDPVVDSVKVTSVSPYYLKKTVQVTVYAKDPNAGIIDSVQFIKSNDTSVIKTQKWLNPNAYTFTTNDSILNDTGLQYIRVRVIDNEGNRSAIMSTKYQIQVLPHTPLIDTLKLPQTAAYINVDIPVTIIALDPCTETYKTTLSYSLSYNDTLNFEPPQLSNVINLKFSTEGLKTFFVKVTDAEKFSAIRADTVTILKGEPVFISGIDQTIEYWINDPHLFTFKCYDPNGSVDKLVIDWGDGKTGSPIIPSSNQKGTFTFEVSNKTFNNVNKKDSTYRINLTFTDNDGLVTTAVDSITVRQGVPLLKTTTGTETLFGKYNSSSLTCTLSVNVVDPNPDGTIIKYYWYSGNAATINKSGIQSTLGPTYVRTDINNSFENKYYDTITVFAVDDDSNIVRAIFPLYIDGPPQIPVLLDPINGSKSFANSSPVTFEWTGHDVHDSLNTKFSIYVRMPGSTTDTIITNPAITVNMVGTVPHFKYNFTNTTTSGSYLWKVVATDQLGSETSSDPIIGHFAIK